MMHHIGGIVNDPFINAELMFKTCRNVSLVMVLSLAPALLEILLICLFWFLIVCSCWRFISSLQL